MQPPSWNRPNKQIYFFAAILLLVGAGDVLLSPHSLLSAAYVPHRVCYLAKPWLVWTNVWMDSLIATAYASIFVSLLWLVDQLRRLPDFRPHQWIFLAFGTFIAACGTTHVMEVVTIWWPYYPLSAALKVVCAAVSVPTAILFALTLPRLRTTVAQLLQNMQKVERQRQAVEEKLRQAEERLRLALVAANGIGIWEWDVAKDLLYADATSALFYGVDEARAAQGAPLLEYTRNLHPDDLPGVTRAITAAVEEHAPYLLEYRLMLPGGKCRWVEARGQCRYSEAGVALRFSGVAVDISDRKAAEAELEEMLLQRMEAVQALTASKKLADEKQAAAAAVLAQANQRFRLLVEGVSDHALLTVDAEGMVTSWNLGAENLLGYVESEIVGRNFSCLFTPEDVEGGVPLRQIAVARITGRSEDEGWRVRGDGERFWANVSKTAFFEAGSHARGYAVLIQDTSERRKVAAVLERTREERTLLQEKFLSHVSHELRTPLTAIYFFTSNVADGIFGALQPQQVEQLELALDNIRQLKQMVSDLLDITRVQSTKLTVEPQHVDPATLITEARSTCLKDAREKRIHLVHSLVLRDSRAGRELERVVPAPTPAAYQAAYQAGTTLEAFPQNLPAIWGDPARVKQILINLVENAIKFTPEGGRVTIEARIRPEEPGFLCFLVTDTGCGIAAGDLSIIFDRLAQVGDHAEVSRSGLGLGLFIASELVASHGGRIWVESRLGVGSTFYFTLPVFSVARLCADILTPHNLAQGCVTLIAVDLVEVGDSKRSEVLPELHRLLTRCLHPSQDVLLPWMGSHSPTMTFFILACTGQRGFSVMDSRFRTELKALSGMDQLQPRISSTTVLIPPGLQAGQRVEEVTHCFERWIAAHLLGQEIVQ